MVLVIDAGCAGDNDALQPESTPQPSASAPTIKVLMTESCVFWGVKVEKADSLLLIGNDTVASWSTGKSKVKEVSLTFNGSAVTFGTLVSKKGTLILTVTNEAEKSASKNIALTDEAVTGLSKLKNVLQVDKEVNLLANLKIAKGFELVKTEIEFDGQRTVIADATHFTPQYPGTCTLFFTVKRNGTEGEVKAENLTIKPLDYKSIEVKNTKPEEILPIVWQVELWDKECYKHIEHLRLAESTRIRDMMWKYGAGNHSPEEYQQLMMRLNTGMMEEYPLWYNNFEILGWGEWWDEWIEHSHIERSIINSLLNHANLKVVYSCDKGNRRNKMETFIKENPKSLLIFWCSACREDDTKEEFKKEEENDKVRELCKSGQIIIFKSGWNLHSRYWVLKNKSYHRDIDWDEHWIYSLQANANWKNDSEADIALLVTVWTSINGNIDQTNEEVESSLFPVWFHNKSLFAWRAFPHHSSISWKIEAEGSVNNWKYATSFTNYVNVAIADLCFQMFAEVKDVDKLLEMIRSTCLTDYITLDWQTQPLQLINPAGFFVKYLMPTEELLTVKQGETLNLGTGYYHGVVFDIPGAEVKINGQWTAFTDKNKDAIKAQNPMNLQWRVNTDQLRKMGYKPGDAVKGRILVVDDQWNGLTISKDITVKVE